jgi:quinoprotein glucose dehydrogenase
LPFAGADDGLVRRAINANYRLAGPEHAQALATFAASTSGSAERRVEALRRLAQWDQDVPLDPVLNAYRPRRGGNRREAVDALRAALPALLSGDAAVATASTEVAAELGITEVAPILAAQFEDRSQSGAQRAAALRSWFRLAGSDLRQAVLTAAQRDVAVEVRAAAIKILAQIDPGETGRIVATVLQGDQVAELQAALQVIPQLPTDQALRLLAAAVDRVAENQFPAAAQLELREALAVPAAAHLQDDFQARRPVDPRGGVAARFPELWQGGDREEGRRIFFEKTEVSCVRCHAVNGVGGGVGPDLSAVAVKRERAYLLESIMEPDAVIAEGFETQLILDLDGVTHFGIVKSETEQHVELMDAEGQLKRILKDDIDQRQRGQSSMPAGLHEKLSPRELRDLVEYLAALNAAS